jgi:spore coat protein CotH
MKTNVPLITRALVAITLGCASSLLAQPGPGFGPPGGPGGFMPGGPMGGQEIKVLEKFDTNGDKHLDATERKAAREFLAKESTNRGGRRGPGGFGGPGGPGGRRGGDVAPTPGEKLTPADVKNYPDAPLYDPSIVRTLFFEFEDTDWEKEMAEFHNTDVDLPAKLTVDGKTYAGVGVRFRGMSSYMMIGEGQKRSLNVSIDYINEDQRLGGVRTLNLLNSHEDPSFLRPVLYSAIARNYLAVPKANFVRVVINGENWGIYANAEQFNKDFTKENFGSGKGARWKVDGSPMGRGSLAYLGDDSKAYKGIYSIKTKDDETDWAALIRLTKVLNETPAEKLEAALAPILDIDGALKFLALENVLINNDGYWIRTSDYSLYLDKDGKFHVVPHDFNETFSKPGGPGFGGGPGGPRMDRAGGPGGPGGNRQGGGRQGGPGFGFGPGNPLAGMIVERGDKNGDGKMTKAEFSAASVDWFDTINGDKAAKLNRDQFVDGLGGIVPPSQGFGGTQGNNGSQGGPRGFGPAQFIGPGLFDAADTDKDGSLTKTEWTGAWSAWFAKWDAAKTGSLDEGQIGAGLNEVLPGPGGPGGMGGPQVDGVKLDPLVAAKDGGKPLISKLLAVPALRQRYLGYVHDIAANWLDWQKLGPVAEGYHSLIDADVKRDTRKLETYEDFAESVSGEMKGRNISIKSFAEQRRAYLLGLPEVKAAGGR